MDGDGEDEEEEEEDFPFLEEVLAAIESVDMTAFNSGGNRSVIDGSLSVALNMFPFEEGGFAETEGAAPALEEGIGLENMGWPFARVVLGFDEVAFESFFFSFELELSVLGSGCLSRRCPGGMSCCMEEAPSPKKSSHEDKPLDILISAFRLIPLGLF